VDLILGGSPCQGFSFAGKGLNFDDPRSALFFEFVRVLEECRELNPDVKFLLENVRMKQEFKDIITEHLGVEPVMINSALVSAQSRMRLYWTNIYGVSQPEDKQTDLVDVLEEDATEPMLSNIYGGFKENKPRIHTGKSVTIRAACGGGHIPSVTLKQPEDKGTLLKDVLEDLPVDKPLSPYMTREFDGVSRLNKGIFNFTDKDKGVAQTSGTGHGNKYLINLKCGRVVGRKINPATGKRDDYNPDLNLEPRIETRLDEKSGTLTTVTKDNVVVLNENQKRKIDKINTTTDKANCLTEAIGRGGSSSEFLTSVKKKTLALEAPTYRKLTCVECERLQTLSDNYTEGISNTQRYKALGNGWTIDVIVHILQGLKWQS
jgi:DNA (cytosine-5)-methyltransferase 3A